MRYDSEAMRRFAQIDLLQGAVPDESVSDRVKFPTQ